MTQRIDQIRENYRKIKAQLLRVDPPGWGFPVYFYPLDGTDNDALVPVDGENLTPSQQDAKLVIRKALEADGSKMFQPGHMEYLARESFRSDLKLIIGELFAAVPTLEQARSAVEADPTSKPSLASPTS